MQAAGVFLLSTQRAGLCPVAQEEIRQRHGAQAAANASQERATCAMTGAVLLQVFGDMRSIHKEELIGVEQQAARVGQAVLFRVSGNRL